jgi:hypothetical protein
MTVILAIVSLLDLVITVVEISLLILISIIYDIAHFYLMVMNIGIALMLLKVIELV